MFPKITSLIALVMASPVLGTPTTCTDTDVRRLGADVAGAPVTPAEVLLELCRGGKTTYQTHYMITDSHLSIVATAKKPSCPSLLFHSGEHKEILKLQDFEPKDGTLYKLGHYHLEDLLQAYEEVDVPDIANESYDIVTNNCASFVLEMFCHMGYETTPSIFKWTLERLADGSNSEGVVKNLKNSSHLTNLPMVDDERTLEEKPEHVIANLVYYYAANHQGSCAKSAKHHGNLY